MADERITDPEATAEYRQGPGWFSFEGRTSRSQFLTHSLVSGIAVIGMVGASAAAPGPAVLLVPLAFLFGIWSELSATVRRLHDLDRPSWHWVLALLPIYNLYLAMVLLVRPGTIGDNQYGPDPLLEGASEADRLLMVATRHEIDGDWPAAFDAYKLAAEKLDGHPDRTYAIECIRRLNDKVSLDPGAVKA